ncbi:tRNA (adenosine(37)-N6)-threonylcarbamoyltransferase complex transferase subunit TsaD [Enterobacteriaceae endosymbiont of Neohaemonia nigricornis]|uniref:tRNA (adenosine(37)-N6)-threonylcarbamoyltransferase complex transferase subunit TsaD n=1 Tax=Enterobacteriaceae endosymbiont of Neohaemonia nigricornis TaxID=2675792 RepID=UPI001448DB58|nr:tRNA (adenosine(37)-N6)-threonylcarbamoyltransferase complex transferase subunit TsaD [Enterobacteriaceae endosymbiont of Neohaemonia nigricornis]QJC30430.1 tRNA (adenosine(37)-N6)-threonylcarbamoyltransferase complex transferase subunit TsaD [Enterobacteriaceae endosymbiont of Neohaemonia nigricornis]
MLILGIETSCDDTAIAIYDKHHGILCNYIKKQTIHDKYGGIVPELAARKHLSNIILLIKKSLLKINKHIKDINGIAYTFGPGLVNSLIIGATIAHTLAYTLNIPIIPINHMEGHLLSIMLNKNKPVYPFIGLLISGGNTQLVYAYKFNKYKIIGNNIDDAVGEVYDKVSKFLKLKVLGGRSIANISKFGIPTQLKFPRPMLTDKNNLNFSFSGLKTSVKNFIQKNKINTFQMKANIAYAFEDAIRETLFIKSLRSLQKYNIKQLVIAGGVSSNMNLRKYFYKNFKSYHIKIFFSNMEYCIDNAAMIAYVGMKKINKYTKYLFWEKIIDPKITLDDNIKNIIFKN